MQFVGRSLGTGVVISALLLSGIFPARAADDKPETSPGEAFRTWTDVSGKHAIEAEFMELVDGKVVLKKQDGKDVTLPLLKLSQEDRAYVRARQKAAASASSVPIPAPDMPWSMTGVERAFTSDYTNSHVDGIVTVSARDEDEVLVLVGFAIQATRGQDDAIDKIIAARAGSVFEIDEPTREELRRGSYALFESAKLSLVTDSGHRSSPVHSIVPFAPTAAIDGDEVKLTVAESLPPWIKPFHVEGGLISLIVVKQNATVQLLFSVPRADAEKRGNWNLQYDDGVPVRVGVKRIR